MLAFRRFLAVAVLAPLVLPIVGCADAAVGANQNDQSYSQTYGGAPLHRQCATPPCGN